MANLKELLSLVKFPSAEKITRISHAYEYAENAYGKQCLTEFCFDHAFETAKILAGLGMGRRTISAGLLHGLIDNTKTTEADIEKEFGKKIAAMVRGVRKLGTIKYDAEKHRTESLAKFFLANASDLQVLIIKLADRLNALRNIPPLLDALERADIAKETMDIYVPLAERVGTGAIKRELETRAFEILYPKEYVYVMDILRSKTEREEKSLGNFKKSLLKILAKKEIRVAKADFRLKSPYSVYQKLRLKGNIDRIFDIKALRVLVDSVADCYRVLGLIHSTWRPLPDRIKDYIALPKPDGYQSIHTTVFIGDGTIVEIQIRTEEMHERAELGIISHGYYKQKDRNPISQWFDKFFPPPLQNAKTEDRRVEKMPQWVRKLVDIDSYFSAQHTFTEEAHNEFFEKQMFVFSRHREVVDLPQQATVIDFAFACEPEKAFHLSGAKVNGKFVPIDERLRNGDVVELHTRKNSKPTPKWFQYAKTAGAKNRIAEYLAE